jgi:hypothetical protein
MPLEQGGASSWLIPFLNQAFTSSNALRRSSPYSLYCFVAARFSPRVHLEGALKNGFFAQIRRYTENFILGISAICLL